MSITDGRRGEIVRWLLLGVAAACALLALAVSGSLIQSVTALFTSTRSLDGDALWPLVRTAFLNDITGKPGLLVSGFKTAFAVATAFGALYAVRSLRGRLKLRLPGVELSGAQSGLVVWCAVFALVKLL